MQKILGRLLALTFAISFVNCSSFAEEFNPIADLATDPIATDTIDDFLNLDLPENLDEGALSEIQPIVSDTKPTTQTTPDTYLLGSGGAIDDSPPAVSNSFATQPIYAPVANEISAVDYSSRTQINLAETGPELIFLISFLAALPLAWFLRKTLYV
jgi:hypothetical protein